MVVGALNLKPEIDDGLVNLEPSDVTVGVVVVVSVWRVVADVPVDVADAV